MSDENRVVAISLINGSGSLSDIERYFNEIGIRFGFLSFNKTVMKKSNKTFSEWIKEKIEELEGMNWVIKQGDKYQLTDKGMAEAQFLYKQMNQSKKFFVKILSPTLVSKLTLITHIVLACIKFPAAIISGSIGLLNDSLDTLADFIASLIVLIGIRTKKEKITNYILVFFIVITGTITLFEAIIRIFQPGKLEISKFTFLAALISAVLCGLLFFYQRFVGIRTHSSPLLTQSIDSRNHVITAIGVLIGLTAAVLKFVWLDIFVGLVVALIICKSAVELIIDIIKSTNSEEIDLSKYRFGIYERFKVNQYTRFLLTLIKDNEFASVDNLKKLAYSKLDTSQNIFLKGFGINNNRGLKKAVENCIEKLFENKLLVKDNILKITEQGMNILKS